MKDPVSRRSRGFGFITYCDIDSVDLALVHEPHTIDARKVMCELYNNIYSGCRFKKVNLSYQQIYKNILIG